MPKFLDIALDIGEKNPDTGGIKATNYFEDYLHEIIDAMGGETSESVVTDATASLMLAALQAKVSNLEKELANVDQANQELLPLRSKVSNLEKDLSNVDQANQELLPLRSKVHELERNIANVDQDNQSLIPLRAKVSNLEDEINNLNQVNQTVIPLNSKVSQLESELNNVEQLQIEHIPVVAKVSKLETDNENQDGLIDSLSNDIAYLRQQINKLRTDPMKDYFLEVSKGNIPGHTAVGKFGEAPSGIQTSPTDIWSRADTTPTQQIWLAPTAANTHTIKSDSAADVSGGTGTTSVTVFYLPDWDTAEASVTVTGDINTGVSMGVSCVMINRMVALPQSTSTGPGPNKGTITATAAAPSATTITSAILPEEGQTEQAIYGFPSGYKVYIDRWSGGIDKSTGAAASADFQIRFNPNPDVQTLAFIRKRDSSVQSTGTSKFENRYKHDNQLTGPGIVKIQAIASAADVDGYSEFDLILVKDGF